MIHKAFSVKDLKAGAFAPPFFMPRVEPAIRAFSDAVMHRDELMHRHPDDFVLYEVGEFDDNLGSVAGYEQPMPVISARKVVDDERARQATTPLEDAIAAVSGRANGANRPSVPREQ